MSRDARPDLVLCHFSAAHLTPPELVDLAARAGYDAVSLMLQMPASAGPGFPVLGDTRTRMRRATKARLDEWSIALHDAATCRLEPDTEVADFVAMVESAAYLGARRINVNGNDPDAARLADRFTELATMVDDHGMGVGLEFMMATTVRTIHDAVALLDHAGVAGVAVTVDALHLSRSGGTASDVAALGADRISYVQLCDAPLVAPDGGFAREAGAGRLLPGAGELPLRELIAAVPEGVLLGIEAPSSDRVASGVSDDTWAAQGRRAILDLLP